ncbi:MAG TPA: hypothetical protein VE907_08295 [Gammaproteobacteria bacterium]|nr:hypothetical protein [Gammaproteobacteria bacterium]
MNLVHMLKSKGVSETGAIEVALGLPLSSIVDRQRLLKLDLPASQASLRQATVSASTVRISTNRSLTPSEVAAAVVNSSVNTQFLTGLVARWSADRAAEDAAVKAAKTAQLKAQLQKQKDQLEKLREQLKKMASQSTSPWQALLNWLRGNPFWPWEWDRYHAQARALRLAIEMQRKMAQNVAQLLERKRTELLKQASSV